MKPLSFWVVFLIFTTVTLGIVGLGSTQDEKKEQTMENDLIVSSVAKALRMANTKARELGYEPKSFYISITEKLDKDDERFFSISEEKYTVWKIYYGPKGKVAFGGDLTIYIDRKTWKIIKVWKGE